MRKFLILTLFLMSFAISGYAQQDPNDPGVQDSIIMGEVLFNPADTMFYFPVFAVCDDSVAFYNIPLRWVAPYGGIVALSRNEYFPPLINWDDNFDSVMLSQSYIRQFGFSDLGGDDNPVLLTGNHRVNIFNICFHVDPDSRRQLIVVDSTWDNLNGSLLLGLADGSTEFTPAFKWGFISWDAIDETFKPSVFSLSQNYPNPFNSSTEIEFSLPQNGPVSLVIYDIQGRDIRRLIDCNLGAGSHSVIWNGINDYGQPVASGVYFYKLNSGNATQTNRMTLLR